MANPRRNVRTRIELITLEERDVPAGTTTAASTTTSSALSNLNTSTISQLTTALNTATTSPTATTATTTPAATTTKAATTTTTAPTTAAAPTPTATSPPPPAAPPGPTFLPDREAKGNAILVDSTATVTQTVAAFETTFTGGAWVTRADVTGDGIPDLIVGAGPGGAPVVRVIDGRDGRIVRSFNAYEASFSGGVIVTAADLNGDGRAEIITGTDQGGAARVRIFNGLDNTVIADFDAIEDANFRGGVRVAVGDINADGVPDLIAAAGFGGGPRVAIFDGKALLGGVPIHLVPDFFAFESSLRDGVYISTGNLDGDKHADLIIGAGPGGAPRVMGLNGAALLGQAPADVVAKPMFDFFAGLGDDRGGVRVGGINRTDGRVDIMAVGGSGGDATVFDVDTRKVSRTVNREIAFGAGLIDDRTPATASASGSSTGASAGTGTGTGTTGTGTTTTGTGTTGTGTTTTGTGATGTGTGTTTGTTAATTTTTLTQLLNLLNGGTTTTGTTGTGTGTGTGTTTGTGTGTRPGG